MELVFLLSKVWFLCIQLLQQSVLLECNIQKDKHEVIDNTK